MTTNPEYSLAFQRNLEELTSNQAAGVIHGEGPQLIVAESGKGKTTVITSRIASLVAAKRARHFWKHAW